MAAACCAGFAWSLAAGQRPAVVDPGAQPPEVVFRASPPQSTTPGYTFRVHPDGSGSFEPGANVAGAVQPADGDARDNATPAALVPFALTPKTTSRIFGDIQVLRHAGFACGAKMKGVADVGTRWLEYHAPDGNGACTYNYTQNRAASDLADVFSGIALTQSEGRKLTYLHKYDRLGLNDEMGTLYTAAQGGQATELATIAPVLQALIDDVEVLERVRVKAASLLKMSGVAE